MPRPKTPKKTNGAETPAVTAGAVSSNLDRAVESTAAPSSAPEGRNDMKTVAPKPNPKPGIVRAESRSNLVPINIEDEIRSLAYLLAERRGFQPGHETDDWLSAEREVLHRYHQHSA